MRKRLAKKIVIVKNRGMGDAIIGLGTVSYIRNLFPEAQIVYVVPGWLPNLFKNAQIPADEVWGLDLSSPRKILLQWLNLSHFKADFVYEMAQRKSSSRFFSSWCRLNGSPYYFHNHHAQEGEVHDQGNVHKPSIQRDLDGAWSFLARRFGLPLPKYTDFAPQIALPDTPWKKEKLVVFGVVATRKTKIWDLEKYVSLATQIRASYPAYRVSIPLPAGKNLSKIDRWVEKQLSSCKLPDGVLLDKIPLEELPAHFSKAALYVGNDTGLKHLAVALGVRTYTFFGPEPPKEWHPYDPIKHPYFYKNDLECRTVKSHYCGLAKCEHMSCLREFRSEDIFAEVRKDLHNDVHS